jgi:hypothetical protein
MKELQSNILDDYQHRVTQSIDFHHDEEGFPSMVQFHTDRTKLDDYLFDYQAILDSEGSQRAQLTLYGIITIIPVIVLSAIPENQLPWGRWSLLVAIAFGLMLAIAIKAIRVAVKQSRLRRLRQAQPEEARYCDAVTQFVNLNQSNTYEQN